jgi:GNAT superfamily N-acetyltransferase
VTSDTSLIRLSALDEERFGVRTAIAQSVSADDVDALIDACRDQSVEFLIARCAAHDLSAAQALERAGAVLTDTLVYYSRKLDEPIPGDVGDTTIRTVDRRAEAPAVVAVATAAFAGYIGHYHADARLERDACDAVYASWAERSVLDAAVADEVLIAEVDGTIVGFLTLRRNSAEQAEVVLNAVTPSAQGRGIYRSLVVRALRWAHDAGADEVIVSTQLQNVAAQKVWVRVGFEPAYGVLTFHRWFV